MHNLDMELAAAGEATANQPSGSAGSPPPEVDAADAIQKLTRDVGRLLNYLGPEPVQFLSMFPPGNGDGPMRVANFTAGDPEATEFVRLSDADNRACYYSLNVVRPGLGKKATKADIVAARGMHVDIDPPKGGGPIDRPATLAVLAALPLVPTYIVNSGNGFQAVWLFNTPAPPTDFTLIENMNRQIAHQTHGDACANIDRLLRVPGSLNTPNAKKAAEGRVPVRTGFVA